MSTPSSTGGRALAHVTLGTGGRSTVLLHGFLGSGKNLRTLAARWAEVTSSRPRGFLLPDLTGHGGSPPLAPGDGLDEVARDVVATALGAGLRPPLSLVGHSLGGRVALAAIRVAEALIEDVVLLDIAPGPMNRGTSESRRVLDVLADAPGEVADRRELKEFLVARGLGSGLADWVLMNVVHEGGRYRWRIDRAALDAFHDVSTGDDLWPVVRAGRVPVRCVRGGRSPYVEDEDARRLAEAGCPVVTLPAAGHYLHVDALDELLAALGP